MKTTILRALGGAMAVVCLFGAQALAQGATRAPDETNLSDLQLLGKRIFEDATLSEPQGMACQSCHDPRHAFQGGNDSKIPGIARGSRPDHLGARKVPTLMYKTYSPEFGFYKDIDDGKETVEPKGGQFWDGRAKTLADQMKIPLTNPDEMNNASLDAVVAKIGGGDYADLAKRALDSQPLDIDGVARAVVAYEETERFAPFSSKFDDWLRGKAKLSALEQRGYRDFVDPNRGNCTACHAGKPGSTDPQDWVFTDFTYVKFGVPRNAALAANADPQHYDLGLCARPEIAAMLPATTKLESLCGAFKVPTLRNVAVNKAFFHNAAMTSLREAVAIYATRDTDPAHWYPHVNGRVANFDDSPADKRDRIDVEVPYDRKVGQKPRLDYGEVDALVAFLKTLTDKGMD
jgi:cytochrome c peroxidase